MTASVPHRGPWTIDDLHDLPDDGNRYEIADGSLLVSPAPNVRHGNVNDRLADLLKRQAPPGLRVLAVGFGVDISRRTTYYVPDLLVVADEVLRRDPEADTLHPTDVLLVAEVLSPSNRRTDLVLKRHDYAAAGIPQYWLVDAPGRTVTVLVLDEEATTYREEAVLKPGDPWRTDRPYPIELDPAELFD